MRPFVAAFFAALVFFLGRAASPVPVDTPRFWVYQVRADGGIAAFSVAPNGDFIPLPFLPVPHIISDAAVSRSSLFPALLRDVTLLLHPKRPVLYAAAPHYQTETKNGEITVSYSEYELRVFGVGSDGHLILRQTLRVSWLPRAFNPNGTRLYVPANGENLDIYAVAENGTLRKTGASAEGGGRDMEFYSGSDGGPLSGNEYALSFAPSGKLAYRSHREIGLDWDTTEWETFRVDAHGLLHTKGTPNLPTPTARQNGGSEWGGTVLGLDRSGRLALLLTELSDVFNAAPFRIVQKIGARKHRETAHFGELRPPEKDAAKVDHVSFGGVLRPDNFIDTTATLYEKGNNKTVTYRALYHLQPNGTVTQTKAWAKLPEASEGTAFGPTAVFIERVGSGSRKK